MKMRMAAIATAALVCVGQSVSAQPVNDFPPGSPGACSAQWRNMMDTHATGDQTRHHFMRQCVTDGSRGSWHDNQALGLIFIAGTIAVIAVAASDDRKTPVSP